MKKSILAITTALFLGLSYWGNDTSNVLATDIYQSLNDSSKHGQIMTTNPVDSQPKKKTEKCCLGKERTTTFKHLEREKAKRKAAREKYQKAKELKSKKTVTKEIPKA